MKVPSCKQEEVLVTEYSGLHLLSNDRQRFIRITKMRQIFHSISFVRKSPYLLPEYITLICIINVDYVYMEPNKHLMRLPDRNCRNNFLQSSEPLRHGAPD